jgi:hypothetical protein
MKNLIKRYWQLLAGMMAGVLLAGAGLGLVVATNGLDNEAGEIENIAPGALSVTDEEARAAVLEAYPGVTIGEVDLDTQDDGSLVYDVDIDSGQEIMVDARTGEVLGAEVDDADSSDDDES